MVTDKHIYAHTLPDHHLFKLYNSQIWHIIKTKKINMNWSNCQLTGQLEAELYTRLEEFRASLSLDDSHSIDYFNSNSSDLDSDAFLEENSVDDGQRKPSGSS